jgi:hypothetical protein
MGIGNLFHSGFVSSIKYDNLTPWFITTSKDQIIEFKDSDNQLRHLNSLSIEAETTDLYVRIMPSDFCLYIGAGESKRYNFEEVSSIQIMGNPNQKLRWFGMFY